MKPEGDVYIDDLDCFTEAGAMGTVKLLLRQLAVSSIKGNHRPYSETEVGPVTQKLYDTLTGDSVWDGSARRLDSKSRTLILIDLVKDEASRFPILRKLLALCYSREKCVRGVWN